MPDARAEGGVAFITVLIAVSFVSIIVIACTTLVTMAARTTAWSVERTKALYAAEAGINHWLFEASIEQTSPGHAKRHDPGGNGKGRGHTHRYGTSGGNRGNGKNQNPNGVDSIENLEVNGEIDGIPYTAHVDSSPSQDLFCVVSTAQASSRGATVSVTAELVPEAWRHVVYAHDPWPPLRRWFPLVMVNEASQYDPSSGANEAVWLAEADSGFAPVPDWGYEGSDGYWFRAAPAWNPPPNKTPIDIPDSGIVVLEGDGPFYIKDCEPKIKEIRASVDGDLYIEDCAVDKISGLVSGNIIVRNTGKNKGVGVITGRVDGSVCIDSSRASPSDHWPVRTTIGSRETRTAVGGSVYLRGRQPGILRDILLIVGPDEVSDGEGTSVGAGVFADEACVYVKGKADIWKTLSWPAILSTGFAVLDGTSGNIRVNGPVYSEAEHAFSVSGLGVDIPDINKWLDEKGLGVLLLGDDLSGESSPSVTIKGNIVSPGSVLLVGNVHVTYDRQLLLNRPPLFVGGKKLTALVAGTWSLSREQATR